MTHIFHPNKDIPSLAAARLQCWVLLLSAYNYDINFKRSKDHRNVDGLSRLPLPSKESTVGEEGITIFNVAQIQVLSLTFQDIKLGAKCDATLSRVLDYVKTGWLKVEWRCTAVTSRRDPLSELNLL